MTTHEDGAFTPEIREAWHEAQRQVLTGPTSEERQHIRFDHWLGEYAAATGRDLQAAGPDGGCQENRDALRAVYPEYAGVYDMITDYFSSSLIVEQP